jgi:hypothetical protein
VGDFSGRFCTVVVSFDDGEVKHFQLGLLVWEVSAALGRGPGSRVLGFDRIVV